MNSKHFNKVEHRTKRREKQRDWERTEKNVPEHKLRRALYGRRAAI